MHKGNFLFDKSIITIAVIITIEDERENSYTIFIGYFEIDTNFLCVYEFKMKVITYYFLSFNVHGFNHLHNNYMLLTSTTINQYITLINIHFYSTPAVSLRELIICIYIYKKDCGRHKTTTYEEKCEHWFFYCKLIFNLINYDINHIANVIHLALMLLEFVYRFHITNREWHRVN